MNACDNEPICAASAGGHVDIVRYLHQNGIALSAHNNEPICRAYANGRIDLLRYLHENGIELTARDNEPLCRACEHGHAEVVRYLHENGAPLNARNNEPIAVRADEAVWRSCATSIRTASNRMPATTSRYVAHARGATSTSCDISTNVAST